MDIINTLIKNLKYEQEIVIKELHDFVSNDKSTRDNTNLPYIKLTDNGYSFTYDNRNYPFRCLSDCNILKEDKKILQNKNEKHLNDVPISIKIALSKGLNYAKLITVIQENNNLMCLIEYEYKGQKYVINYSLNLIMKKDDYYDLFKPKEVNILDKIDLYKLTEFFGYVSPDFNLYYIIIFGSEMLDNLKKNFSYFTKKFSKEGMYINNSYALNDPYMIYSYDVVINEMDNEIQKFTLGHGPCENITYDVDKDFYLYDDSIQFRLLSDYLPEKYKHILLSQDRFGHCHDNSRKILREIYGSELVSGLIKINDLEYLLHSWIEKDNMVYDFNRNVIMKKEDYYKMLDAKVVNRSTKELIDENRNFYKLLKFSRHNFILFDNYFSKELNRDLKKHLYLLEKQKDSK